MEASSSVQQDCVAFPSSGAGGSASVMQTINGSTNCALMTLAATETSPWDLLRAKFLQACQFKYPTLLLKIMLLNIKTSLSKRAKCSKKEIKLTFVNCML
ncbi:Zinc finger protein CONSTANS-LIKE 12 [Sesbania bispinosa]|nr:Zinc finger protein CONSTANS-LIKE 12 [Sesbania bispinosa]